MRWKELNLEFVGVLTHIKNMLSLKKLYKREVNIRLLLRLPQKAIDKGTWLCCMQADT